MKFFFFMCICLVAVVFCKSVQETELASHVSAKSIAFIKFSRDQISDVDFPANANVICQAVHIPRVKEYSVSDLHFMCFSTMESEGFEVEVQSIHCAMDESDNDYEKIITPIRDGSCRLVPHVKLLPPDYRQNLELFKKQHMWFCEKADCSSLQLTFYDIVNYRVSEIMRGTSNETNIKCDSQICFFDQHSPFNFYKKLLLLFWNK